MSRYVSRAAVEWALAQRQGRHIGPTEGDLLLLMALHVADKRMTPKGERDEWPPHHSWMTIASLAAHSGRDLRTVRTCLSRLVAAGLIATAGRRRSGAAVYHLAVSPDTFAKEDADRALTVLQPSPDTFAPSLIKAIEGSTSRESVPTRKLAGTRAFASHGKRALETFAEWRVGLEASGEGLIPPGDPIFAFCDDAGIDREMLAVAWGHFKSEFTQDSFHTTSRNWPGKFRQAIKRNGYRLWFIDRVGAAANWTTAGLQALRAHRRSIDIHRHDDSQAPPAEAAPAVGMPDSIKRRLAALRHSERGSAHA